MSEDWLCEKNYFLQVRIFKGMYNLRLQNKVYFFLLGLLFFFYFLEYFVCVTVLVLTTKVLLNQVCLDFY